MSGWLLGELLVLEGEPTEVVVAVATGDPVAAGEAALGSDHLARRGDSKHGDHGR